MINVDESPNILDVTQAHIQGVDTDHVIICGGGYSGCDSAIELAQRGKKDVTIVEMTDDLATNAMPLNKASILRLLDELNINLMKNTKVMSVTADGVKVVDADGNEQFIKGDTMITAFGTVPDRAVVDAVEKKYPTKVAVIGDCNKTGKTATAIRDGYYAAMALQ